MRDKETEAGGQEGDGKKLPFPKSLFFIIGNEFCERFSYYGMKAILVLYFKQKLHFSEDISTELYHAFSGLCYLFPIFGAMLADQVLGKYRTIFWISLIYVLGHLLKTLAAVPTLGVPPVEFSLIGLFFIAVGTGGIKPCVSAFGGDQFKLPEQERQLQTFFSVFYFAINAGSLISTFLTPIFREDVECFGEDTCYSLAFGVPAALMGVATILLVLGKNMYVMKPPEGNIMTKVIGSIYYALKRRITSGSEREHWLDYAKEKYDNGIVEDVKCLLRVLWMYLPLPMFWALFDQLGSRWTFQATRMDGSLGSFSIKPDQMQLLNPALILLLIPLFDMVIYPAFAKINLLKKPLQRIAIGGTLAGAAFVISGFLELATMKTYEILPAATESHVNIMNSLSCDIEILLSTVENGSLGSPHQIEGRVNKIIRELEPRDYRFEIRVSDDDCPQVSEYVRKFDVPQLDEESVTGFVIRAGRDKSLELVELNKKEKPKKAHGGDNKLKVVFDTGAAFDETLSIRPVGSEDESDEIEIASNFTNGDLQETNYVNLHSGVYDVYSGRNHLGEVQFGQGGVYTFFVHGNQDLGYEQTLSRFKLTSENSVHMLWQVPGYFVMTTGEIMLSITGLEFSYSQAPESMKSVLQAAWLLTVAFGNLIVILIAHAKAFNDQASEFFMFAVLMFIDMGIFSVMAYFYKYVDYNDLKRNHENENDDQEMSTRRPGSGVDNDGYSGSTNM